MKKSGWYKTWTSIIKNPYFGKQKIRSPAVPDLRKFNLGHNTVFDHEIDRERLWHYICLDL